MASPSHQNLRFKDKVVIVTGGCNGIGRGCVDIFVENGGKVTVLDIDETVGKSLYTEGPGEMYFIHCDITNEEQLKNAIVATYEKFGRIDCLINNAGRHPGLRSIDEISTEQFKRLIDLLLVAHFVASREALPYLRKTKGSIINISSISGVTGQTGCVDYCAGKSGLAGLTRSLSCEEAKHGVRVNTIAPGPITTPALERFFFDGSGDGEASRQTALELMQMKRFGEPREIGLACLYLAVDATFTTGEELRCSGGIEVGFGSKVD